MKKKFPICTLNHLYVLPFIFISQGFSYNELPSERFHDWLNSNFISVSIYDSDCNSLDYSYKNNYGIKKLCAKVVKYIKSKPSITNIKHLKDHHCNLFNYWIYEQLVNECKDKSIKPALVFGNFLLVLSGLEYYQKENTCELDNKVATIPDITDRRKLYEYCVDCKTILDNYKHSKEKCQKYYTYVKKKIELYKKFHKLCSPDYESKCPDLYKICDNCDPSVLLAQLKCDEIGVNDKALHEVAPGTTRNTSPSIESVSNLGNAFLGVVVTSMTSGFLYKVNTNLIKINQ
ncbi:hypothetical protein PVMG_05108 [Plasmodium vivax Mauritania I]|uniref:Uncharacterized protein n=1 Tax=Plasmodium vivax Mauritania I TaxID=1035515 RepID=A0A0J9THR4_PLAVI|nr:hypothetical protein PVMG_05108 [Plasmodium vivax Mauritania I]